MRAFIIRPFGIKAGIDFNRVERELIGPALDRLGIAGRTTGDVIEAGNIREDMFQLLLLSDLVIADISIDNPNAYYELGIRHALREKRTFLIRARGMAGDVPFDIRTDRYLPYDSAEPSGAGDALYEGLRATIASERQDSPVFRVLPELREHERSRFLPVPREFREEVEYAARSKLLGRLALLAEDARGSVWESEGLRIVGREQFQAKAFDAACTTLEHLRALEPLDREANLLLGTIYQRQGDLARSEVALRRVTGGTDAPPRDRAEAYSLLGRNLKAQWRESWSGLPAERQRIQALRSPLLERSCDAYLTGFQQDLNHFYSGLNALAMVTILLELGAELPEVWSDRFPSDEEAGRARERFGARRTQLAAAVEFAIDTGRQLLRTQGTTDPWVEVSLADLRFLTSSRAGQIAHAYEAALAGSPDFVAASVRSQLLLYRDLGLFVERVERVLEVLGPAPEAPAVTGAPPRRVLLFTGHQIDAPGRTDPRFPAVKEEVARAAIRDAVERELARCGAAVGIAGGASGGDILFHEVCLDLGIETRLYLALPPDAYVSESVAPAGPDWVRRFWDLTARVQAPPVLSRTTALPGWLRHRKGYSIWQRNNLWMLNEALAEGAQNVTLIALWNGREGDGPGGTAHMIEIARGRGAEVRVLDTNALFG